MWSYETEAITYDTAQHSGQMYCMGQTARQVYKYNSTDCHSIPIWSNFIFFFTFG